ARRRCPPRPRDERPDVEPGSGALRPRDAPDRTRGGDDREGPRRRHGRLPRLTGWRHRPRLRDGDRPQEPRPERRDRLPDARDRLRPGPGPARLLPGAGAAGHHPPGPHRRRPRHLADCLGGGSGHGAVRLRPPDGGGGPDRRAGAGPPLVGGRPADGRPRPLRPERLRLRYRQRRPAAGEGARAAAVDGRGRDGPRCLPPDRREFPRGARPLRRPGHRQPLQLPGAGAGGPPARRRDDRPAGRARRGDRGGDGRLDAGAGLGPRRDDQRAPDAGGGRRPDRPRLPARRQQPARRDRDGPRRRLRDRADPARPRHHRRRPEDPRPAAPPRLRGGRRGGSHARQLVTADGAGVADGM
ncbi:MAG: hypothetical protein AVDCRST_MAG59-440, partial [uncultured Thermomicrobiales bacterium]